MALVSLLSAVTGGRDQVEDGCFFLIDDLAFGHPAVRDSVGPTGVPAQSRPAALRPP